jgi:hypothetical protein
LLRIVLEAIFKTNGMRYALFTSMVIALLLSLSSFLYQAFLIGALFFLFAYQSYDAWKKMRSLTDKDRDAKFQSDFEQAEMDFEKGNKESALAVFEKIRFETQGGLLNKLATQYVALLKYEAGKIKEAYDLLYPMRQSLEGDVLYLFHKTAFEVGNFPLVVELSGPCFQAFPSAELALRNALACAQLQDVKPAIGWLEAAFQDEGSGLREVIKDPRFDPIRSDPLFLDLEKKLSD